MLLPLFQADPAEVILALQRDRAQIYFNKRRRKKSRKRFKKKKKFKIHEYNKKLTEKTVFLLYCLYLGTLHMVATLILLNG